MKPHKHAEIIKAWADGAVIERLWSDEHWLIDNQPMWEEWEEYRIKPEARHDVIYFFDVDKYKRIHQIDTVSGQPNLKLTFDGETGELKSAEVLK